MVPQAVEDCVRVIVEAGVAVAKLTEACAELEGETESDEVPLLQAVTKLVTEMVPVAAGVAVERKKEGEEEPLIVTDVERVTVAAAVEVPLVSGVEVEVPEAEGDAPLVGVPELQADTVPVEAAVLECVMVVFEVCEALAEAAEDWVPESRVETLELDEALGHGVALRDAALLPLEETEAVRVAPPVLVPDAEKVARLSVAVGVEPDEPEMEV